MLNLQCVPVISILYLGIIACHLIFPNGGMGGLLSWQDINVELSFNSRVTHSVFHLIRFGSCGDKTYKCVTLRSTLNRLPTLVKSWQDY